MEVCYFIDNNKIKPKFCTKNELSFGDSWPHLRKDFYDSRKRKIYTDQLFSSAY
jgi:hypothetical protein